MNTRLGDCLITLPVVGGVNANLPKIRITSVESLTWGTVMVFLIDEGGQPHMWAVPSDSNAC